MLPVVKLPPFIEYFLGAGHGVVVGILCIISFNCYYVDIHRFIEEEIQVQGTKLTLGFCQRSTWNANYFLCLDSSLLLGLSLTFEFII